MAQGELIAVRLTPRQMGGAEALAKAGGHGTPAKWLSKLALKAIEDAELGMEIPRNGEVLTIGVPDGVPEVLQSGALVEDWAEATEEATQAIPVMREPEAMDNRIESSDNAGGGHQTEQEDESPTALLLKRRRERQEKGELPPDYRPPSWADLAKEDKQEWAAYWKGRVPWPEGFAGFDAAAKIKWLDANWPLRKDEAQ